MRKPNGSSRVDQVARTLIPAGIGAAAGIVLSVKSASWQAWLITLPVACLAGLVALKILAHMRNR